MPNDEKIQFIYNKIQDIVKDAVMNVRELSYALSPNIVINFGLYRAVQNIIEKNNALINIKLHSNIDGYYFKINVEIVYYRILKELVNNTLKHAGAKRIDIHLYFKDKFLTLDYKDDGKGFDVEKTLDKKQGSGLINIISRVKLIDGSYSFPSNEKKGFSIQIVTKTQMR